MSQPRDKAGQQSVAAPRQEIERKFRVIGDDWRAGAKAYPITQGYIAQREGFEVRLRETDQTAFLTLKGRQADARIRIEYEYEVPREDAQNLLRHFAQGSLIQKTRHEVTFAGNLWEVDVFEGENAGLVVAEIELSSVDQTFEHPPWLGEEITGDKRYSNVALAQHPYTRWGSA
ncbi:MAG TPA: adenylate cyclase [Alphaproteobacteria bacterium]|jgi:adenylate cyclase|nr:adenylate cyclase [Alphaproteobacteria bacterium]